MTALTCVNHPDRPSRVNLDSEELCQECADAWVRGEGSHAAWLEAEEQGRSQAGTTESTNLAREEQP